MLAWESLSETNGITFNRSINVHIDDDQSTNCVIEADDLSVT